MKITKDRDGIRHCVRVFATMLCAATDNPRLRAAIRNAISGCDIEAEIPGVVECTSLEVWSQNLLLTHFINSVDSTDLRLEALLCAATCLAFKYAGIFLAHHGKIHGHSLKKIHRVVLILPPLRQVLAKNILKKI